MYLELSGGFIRFNLTTLISEGSERLVSQITSHSLRFFSVLYLSFFPRFHGCFVEIVSLFVTESSKKRHCFLSF